MDTIIRTPAPDGAGVYAVYNPCGTQPAARAVVLAHGLTGNPNEYIHKTAQRHFNAAGYDVYRIAFYGPQADARKLHDCTLAIHAADLTLVLDAIRPKHKYLYCAGHSFGGLTLLIANPALSAAAFWDSSFTPWAAAWSARKVHDPVHDIFTVGWGMSIRISPAMYDEVRGIDARAEGMAAAFRAPALVALADKGQENPRPTHLYDSLAGDKKLARFAQASHCFWEEDSAQNLAAATQNWFDAHG